MNTIQQGQQLLALKKNRQDKENKKKADMKVHKYSDEIKRLVNNFFSTYYDKWSIIVILYEYLIQECNKHITPKEEKCRSREEFDKELKEIEDQINHNEIITEDEKYENLVMLVLYF